MLKIAKCYVKMIIGENQENKKAYAHPCDAAKKRRTRNEYR
jgi:hypothetical protein